ncbi:putative disease resistance protein RGA4 isoform X2 [Quercus suber]|uniref:putative disease resistance protein RGA4 isoform X2 n=1 Tax=Quercus suber TaxID=58331 RepID=UPI0032DED342
MAEGVLFDLGKEVLKVVGSLALQEIKLASGVKAELENLKSTVSTIQAVLLDAEKQGSHNNEVKDWLKKLRDVFLDADDVLDDFSTEALQHKVMTGSKMTKEVHIFFSSSNQLAFSLKMGHRIKEIRERLSIIAKDKDDFHFIQNSVEPQVMNRDRETYSFVLEEDVVGREDDKNKIINLLLDSNTVENVSIIPIVGIGGLGKTTLAQLIYNDEIVKNNFELKLWICVSDNFDLKHIVKQILESWGNRRDEESLEILQNNLRGKLNGKKYFIVLDDLWNEDKIKWIPLKNLLMGGARGSKIVVTTRSIKVAEITGTTSPHKLEGLDPKKSWSLFVKMAFKEGKEPEYQGIVDLGKTIVGKCIGVPLAIRTIGSLLYGKTSYIEWQSFLENELSKLTQQENDISLTLKLSYDYLPSHLKQCFAYCRLFPKDYRIDVNTLINLWVAQGFIVLEGPRQRFEDIGRKYFMELLWRSFFQDVENDHLGNIGLCKMHDLMHDLAILVSGTESAILNSSGENVIEKVRHVSFNLVDSLTQFQIPMANKRKIRTILAASTGRSWGYLTCDALISNFNYLRTLDLNKLHIHVVPHSIGKLKHLRYLDLSKNENIELLPDSITKLLNLLVLKLGDCHSLKELPRGLKNLVKLRHLDITWCYKLTHMPLGLGHLTSLEILTEFVVRQEDLKARSGGGLSELKELSNVGGSLKIRHLGHGEDDVVECKATNMKDKQHLQQLTLLWKDIWDDGETECYDEMSLEGLRPHPNLKSLEVWFYMGVRIPSWVSSLTNLVKFELNFLHKLQHIPPLNQLPFLKSVWVDGMEALEYIEYIWIDEESVSNVLGASSSSSSKTPFFPSLSSLKLVDCPKLKGWWRNSNDDNEPHHLLLPSFPPSLSELHISNCPNLTYMPPFPYFKKPLNLWRCSWKVLEQTMKMGAATTSTYFPPLSQLQELLLEKMNDFESLPEEWLRNLVSLRQLSIRWCDGLVSLPWIGSLTSLQSLEIQSCHNLTSLPQEIRNLASLKSLSISRCPLLGQRCKRQIGEDWPFIAHVPLVEVYPQNQQEETISSGEYWPFIAHVPRVLVDGWNQQEETSSPESDLESKSVCLLPEDELILQQPLQDWDCIIGISLFHSLLFIFFLFWGLYIY